MRYIFRFPNDLLKSYTFSVLSYQPYTGNSNRYFANTISIMDEDSKSVGDGIILFNGGIPTFTGTNKCLIIQQFSVISISNARYVVSSVSVCY